ncbi:MAG TPA: hypothetical protein PL168_02560 [Methanobacterium sp.]|jgi:hypothetical protein|nr:hypothetical protein [Methanobacterium sp.]HOI39587.1 hypothetical protein [Methanobacterium sp.]
MVEKNEEQYWMLGFLGFLGFSGISGFTSHDPLQFLLFCGFGLFGFFTYKYPSKAITAVALLGVALGLILTILGITGIIIF